MSSRRVSEKGKSERTGKRAEGERLQKLIARAGLASRRAAEDWIRSGRVTVNGAVADLGDRARPGRDAIKVDGRQLRLPSRQHTLALNKPMGVVTTLSDPEGRRTVLDLVPPRYRKGLFPVGRLDFATEGLLLLTTDGDLAQRIAHPTGGCVKQYQVKVKGKPREEDLERLRSGFRLHGKRLSPVVIERRIPPGPKRTGAAPTNSWWKVELTEGKTRQIREMFQRIGHPVQRLRRVQIASVKLHGLKPGDLRELDERELGELEASLARASKKPPSARVAPKRARPSTPTSSRGGKAPAERSSRPLKPARKARPPKQQAGAKKTKKRGASGKAPRRPRTR